MKKLILILTSLWLVACSSDQPATDNSGAEASAELNSYYDEMNKKLEIGNHSFGFSTQKTNMLPCGQFLSDLKDIKAKAIKTDKKIKGSPHASADVPDGVRDLKVESKELLDFLNEVESNLDSYCESDHRRFLDCTGNPKFVSITINENVVNTPLVNTYVQAIDFDKEEILGEDIRFALAHTGKLETSYLLKYRHIVGYGVSSSRVSREQGDYLNKEGKQYLEDVLACVEEDDYEIKSEIGIMTKSIVEKIIDWQW